jgi:hypothetical protein
MLGAGTGYVAGCWVLGAGCWVLGAGYWVLGMNMEHGKHGWMGPGRRVVEAGQ